MSKYIVEKRDLKGEIKNFPIEVVQRMVDYQVLQGNKADVSVFQDNMYAPHWGGGFDWDETKEGHAFWERIIENSEFYPFFEQFSNDKVYTCMLADKSKHNANIIKHLEELGGKNTREFKIAFSDIIYYISPSKTISTLPMNDDSFALLDMAGFHFVWCADDESIKEYTMDEIADALGIAVENLRIKK